MSTNLSHIKLLVGKIESQLEITETLLQELKKLLLEELDNGR